MSTPITTRTLNTFVASATLAALAQKIDPELMRVNWYSFLNENRRDPYSDSAMESGQPRGNQRTYGRVPFDRASGQRWYSKGDLQTFADHLKHNPGLVDLLKSSIVYRKTA